MVQVVQVVNVVQAVRVAWMVRVARLPSWSSVFFLHYMWLQVHHDLLTHTGVNTSSGNSVSQPAMMKDGKLRKFFHLHITNIYDIHLCNLDERVSWRKVVFSVKLKCSSCNPDG